MAFAAALTIAAAEEPTADQTEDLSEKIWLSDNEFMMYKFKVALCNRHTEHDRDKCPYAHPVERTCRRRDPTKVNYTSIICVDMMPKGRCPKGRSCTAAHTIYEYWLHPDRYRTEMCKVGTNCNRRICFFAHKPEELRPLPPHLAGTTGSLSTGKYSLSATRQAAAAARPKASFYSQAYPAVGAHLLPQQQPYMFDAQHAHMAATASSSTSLSAGCTPHAGMIPQQPFDIGASAALLAQDAAAWHYQQPGAYTFNTNPQSVAAGSSLITQMQQLGLANNVTARAAPTSNTGTLPIATCGTPVLGASTQWVTTSEPLTVSQHELMGDALMHGWAQQQQQHMQPQMLQDPARSFGSVDGLLQGAPQLQACGMLPNTQQQQLLLHLFGTQGLAYARSLAQVQASNSPVPGAHPYARFAPQGAGMGIMQPAHLPDGQSPWMV